MTFSKLLEIIEAMSDEQKDMEVVLLFEGTYVMPSMASEIIFNEAEGEDEYPLGQVFLV
jgi:hypothetical protein